MFSSHRSAASAPVIGHSSIAGGVGTRGSPIRLLAAAYGSGALEPHGQLLLRVTLPTFSDSTSTRSPTSTIIDLLWMVTETRPPQVAPGRRLHSTRVVVTIARAIRS